VFKNPAAFDWWSDAADDPENANWAQIFEGYAATVDWPNATYYQELADAYPKAKVILTERDPETWFESTQATIFANDMPDDGTSPFPRMVRKVIYPLFDGRMHDKDKLISVFRAHNARVREVIPAERLLVYESPRAGGRSVISSAWPFPSTPCRRSIRARSSALASPRKSGTGSNARRRR
jgi:hypothetical protein